MSSILPQHRYVSIPPGNYGYGPSSYERAPLSRNLGTYNQSPGIFMESEFYAPSYYRRFSESQAAFWYYNLRGYRFNGENHFFPRRSFTTRKKNIQEGFWITQNFSRIGAASLTQEDAGYGIMPSFYYQRAGRNGVFDYIAYFYRSLASAPDDLDAGDYPYDYYAAGNITLGEQKLMLAFNELEGVSDLFQAASTTYQYTVVDSEGEEEVITNTATFDYASYFSADPNTFDYGTKDARFLTCTLTPYANDNVSEYWTAYGTAAEQTNVRTFANGQYQNEGILGSVILSNSPIIIPYNTETRYYQGVPYYIRHPRTTSSRTFDFELIFE